MGVVIRQGAKSSLFSYLSIVLGFVNTIIIYPLVLEVNELGEIQFVLQTAVLILPFLIFGFSSVSTKFFSKYSSSDDDVSGFLTFLYLPPIITGILLIFLFYLFQETFFDFFKGERTVSSAAIKAIPLIAIFMSFSSISSSFSANLKRIAIPNLLNNLIKIVLPLLCLSYHYKLIDFNTIYLLLAFFYGVLVFVFFAYLRSIKKVKLTLSLVKKLDTPKILEMLKFAGFGILATIGSQLATRIDSVMVTSLKSTYANGIYSVAMFISNTVMVPLGIVAAIASPLIAGYWHSKNMKELDDIYRKSSINLFVLGLGVFLVIWASIDGLFALMPRGDEYAAGKLVILILGVAKLIDMITGLSSQMLSLSPKYPVYFYMLVGLAFFNVFLNIKLIPIYGINGAAISTFISLTLFNVLKFLYLRLRYNLNPFSWDMLKVLVLGCLLFLGLEYIPRFENHWLNLVLFPMLTIVVFLFVVLRLKVSEDLGNIYQNVLKRLKSFINV